MLNQFFVSVQTGFENFELRGYHMMGAAIVIALAVARSMNFIGQLA